MAKIKRKWDLLSKEQRTDAINKIIVFFQKERDEEIGMLAAEEILDCVLETTALDIYNIGVKDSKSLLQKRFEDFAIDLEVLMDK